MKRKYWLGAAAGALGMSSMAASSQAAPLASGASDMRAAAAGITAVQKRTLVPPPLSLRLLAATALPVWLSPLPSLPLLRLWTELRLLRRPAALSSLVVVIVDPVGRPKGRPHPSKPQDLAWVHDALRIERVLERAHHVELERRLVVLELGQPRAADAVLGADGAGQVGDDVVHDAVDARALLAIARDVPIHAA